MNDFTMNSKKVKYYTKNYTDKVSTYSKLTKIASGGGLTQTVGGPSQFVTLTYFYTVSRKKLVHRTSNV